MLKNDTFVHLQHVGKFVQVKVSLHLHSALANTGFSGGLVTATQQADGGNFQYVQQQVYYPHYG